MEVTFSKKSGWLAKKVWKMHSEGIRIACLDFKIKLKKIYQVNIYIYILFALSNILVSQVCYSV